MATNSVLSVSDTIERTALERWRLEIKDAIHYWRYLDESQSVQQPQSTVEKYFLGLPTACVSPIALHASVNSLTRISPFQVSTFTTRIAIPRRHYPQWLYILSRPPICRRALGMWIYGPSVWSSPTLCHVRGQQTNPKGVVHRVDPIHGKSCERGWWLGISLAWTILNSHDNVELRCTTYSWHGARPCTCSKGTEMPSRFR